MRYSTTVGVDLAKNVIQISVVNGRGKELTHHWARAAERHGHEARIIPAKAVAPFRQGHKTDSNDALAEFSMSAKAPKSCRLSKLDLNG
jgi:transposase